MSGRENRHAGASRRLGLGMLWAALFALIVLAPAGATSTAPVTGSVFGPITKVKGKTFKMTTSLSPTGASTVAVVSSTTITEQVTAPRKSLKVGTCVTASGARNSKGVVAATQMTISAPVKGQCNGGFGRGRTGGARPGGARSGPTGSRGPGSGSGTQRPPGGFANGNFGFAFGKVLSIKKNTLTVRGRRPSFQGGTAATTVTTKVTVSAKTSLLKTATVGASALKVKLCAFVYGTSSDKGVKVHAQSIRLTAPSSNGCNGGFRRGGA